MKILFRLLYVITFPIILLISIFTFLPIIAIIWIATGDEVDIGPDYLADSIAELIREM